MDFDTVISHPKSADHDSIPLAEHHETVAERMRASLPDISLDTRSYASLGYYIGSLHDIAKGTPSNQRYLRTGDSSHQQNHSLPSAIVAYHLLDEIGASDREKAIVTYVIAKHHSRQLSSTGVRQYFTDNITKNDYVEAIQTLATIADNDVTMEAANALILDLTDNATGWKGLFEDMETYDAYHDMMEVLTDSDVVDEETYDDVLVFWSSLAHADITHAAAPTVTHTQRRPTASLVEDRIQAFSEDTALDKLRNQIREDILQNVDQLAWDDFEVGYIPVPTGGGKTLAGTNAALRLLDKKHGSTGDVEENAGTLVYALPYTSIIDQTADEMEGILERGGYTAEELLVKHHHLADTRISLSSADKDAEALYGTSWETGWVLTTFVQLFETLVAPTRRQSTKLPQLNESVIVLDEPQALPYTWWPLIRRVMRILVDTYDARIISMTATPPYIFDEFDSRTLVTNDETYFDDPAIDRVTYEFDASAVNESELTEPTALADKMRQDVSENEVDVLAVCNTIDSSKTVFSELEQQVSGVTLNQLLEDWETNSSVDREMYDDFGDYVKRTVGNGDVVIAHLSSRHRMKDRRRIISVLQERPDDASFALVSTQLIEAGVDIDFEKAYRDFAPLQSIVQTAGRCNREGELDTGRVIVTQLAASDPDGKAPSKAIYERGQGANLLAHTRDALKETVTLTANREYPQKIIAYDATRCYFNNLDNANIGNKTYVNWLETGQFDRLTNLSLIERTRSVDVFVAKTRDEQAVLGDLRENAMNHNWDEFDRLTTEHSDLLVSVPTYTDEDERQAVHAFDAISDNTTQFTDTEYYSYTTGLEIPESTASSRLL